MEAEKGGRVGEDVRRLSGRASVQQQQSHYFSLSSAIAVLLAVVWRLATRQRQQVAASEKR